VTLLTPEQEAAAIARGQAIAKETFSLLSSNLQSAIVSGGVTNALPYCSLAASPLTASIAERHGVALQRITQRPRNPEARADAQEEVVLAQFQARVQSGTAPRPLATNLLAGRATFFAPIVIQNELCLNCHGVPGREIQSETQALLTKLYPQDEATGYREGDLRGAWRIDIPLAALGPSGDAERRE
jgi:hypothetical protein